MPSLNPQLVAVNKHVSILGLLLVELNNMLVLRFKMPMNDVVQARFEFGPIFWEMFCLSSDSTV